MDFFVIISASISFIMFLCIKIIILRLRGPSAIIKSLSLAFMAASIIHLILFGFMAVVLYNLFILSLVSFVMFGLLAFLFTLGLFGPVTTSLRIQLLIEIQKKGKTGISYLQLLKKYNRDIIVRKRLDRLVSIGEIQKNGNVYQYKEKISYFRLHTFVLVLLNRLFKTENYKI